MNTLGIATGMSLLAFAADGNPKSATGRIFMLYASLESPGSLIGIGVLYPIYQWSLTKGSWAGGTAYYICAMRLSLLSIIPNAHSWDAGCVCGGRISRLVPEAGHWPQFSAW